jgi:hypothetical protein
MIRRARYAIAWIIAMAALASGLAARAEDQFKLFDEKQIRARVVGKDITDGPHWSMYLRPDGVLVGAESGSSWNGSWNIRENKLCLSYPSSPAPECNHVWMSGANIRMRTNKDQQTFMRMSRPIGAADERNSGQHPKTMCLTKEDTMRIKLCVLMLAMSIAADASAQTIDGKIFSEPFISSAHAQQVDWQKVDDALGRKPATSGDVRRYGFPRSDLTVTLDGVTVKPSLALGGWIAFSRCMMGP